ncbi:hypothetical protein [Xylanimonas protaetiae]|uniref:Potassium transporter Trk n=1 Tax=Xylanimonas protaetiae TaxID=2509457 RepID=A0A4P6F7N4_9MICO|nr:hypothetical protein [Xylanimonas protaetiae]QAY69267.1 hypothetical protein ET471_03795 [Xylanimonas protaetiae]
MSNAPEQPGDKPADDVDLRSVVDPASVRRAPRYKGFLVTGGIVGFVAGLALGLYLLATYDPSRDQYMDKPGVWLTVTVAATTTVAILLAGLLATILDRRSLKRWSAQHDIRQDAEPGV